MFKRFLEGFDSKDQSEKSMDKMNKQIEEKGGSLTFTMSITESGWVAECQEFPGIVTGGVEKNPNEMTVSNSINDAVRTAFDIPVKTLDRDNSSTTIKLEREFQLI